jgi:hypothetical protein
MSAVSGGRLFAVAELPQAEVVSGTAAVGAAAEHEAISVLLRRGLKVAVPVVDDDGVDLVVGYRVAVQVKYTAQTTRDGCPLLCVARWVRRHASEQPVWKPFPAHVDVLMVLVEGVGWYVIPRERVGDRRNMTLGRSMDEWREAWSVFDAA